MPITPTDIESLRNTATTSMQEATDYASKGSNVEAELKSALSSKLAANTPLIEGRNQAMASYLSAPADARAKYADPTSQDYVFNPYQRQKLVANEQSLAYVPYATLSDYIGLQRGSISDLSKQGYNQYMGVANNKLQQAGLQQTQYQNALDEYLKMQENSRQNAAAGSASNSIGPMLAALLGGGGMSQPTEAQPQYSPSSNGAMSKGGEWRFQDTKWVPTSTGSGSQPQDMQQVIGQAMMSIANTPTEIAAAYSMINPTEKSPQVKLKQEQASKQQAYDKAQRLITQALSVIGEGGSSAGWNPLYGLQKSGAPLVGKADTNRLKLDAILSELAGPLAFGEAGKALTATELGIVGGKVPTVGLSEDTLTNMLKQVMSNIESQRKEYLFSQVGL